MGLLRDFGLLWLAGIMALGAVLLAWYEPLGMILAGIALALLAADMARYVRGPRKGRHRSRKGRHRRG